MGAYDLGELGPAQVASSGLQGLLEAYKMSLAQATENAKLKQSGFNANASMPYKMATLALNDKKAEETKRHDYATEGQNGMLSPESIQIHKENIINGTDSLSRIQQTLNPRAKMQSTAAIQDAVNSEMPGFDWGASEGRYKARMYAAGATAQGVTRSIDAMDTVVGNLRKSLGFNAETGAYDLPTEQGSIPLLNKARSSWGHNVGGHDPRKDIKSQVQVLQDEAKNISRNGSNKNMELAAGLLDADAPKVDLIKGLQYFNEGLLESRKNAYSMDPVPGDRLMSTLKAALPSTPTAPTGGPMSTLRAALPKASVSATPAVPQYSQTGTHADGSKWGLNTTTNQWERVGQ